MGRKLFMRNDPAVVTAASTLSLEEFIGKFKDATSEETLTKAYEEIRKKAGLNKTAAQRKPNIKKEEPIAPPVAEVPAEETEPAETEEEPAEEIGDVKAEFTAEDGAAVKVKKVGKSTVVEVEEPVTGEATEGTEDNSDEVAAAKKGGKATKEKKEKVKKEKSEGSAARRSPEEMAAFRQRVIDLIGTGLSDSKVVSTLAAEGIKTYPPQVKGIRDSLAKVVIDEEAAAQ